MRGLRFGFHIGCDSSFTLDVSFTQDSSLTQTLLHKQHNLYAFFATNITPRKSVVIMDNLILNPHPTSNTLSVYGVHIRFSSCISKPQSTIVFFSSSYDNSMLLPYRSSISSAVMSSEHYTSLTPLAATCQ